MNKRQQIADLQSTGEAKERLLNLERCLVYYITDLFYVLQLQSHLRESNYMHA